MNRNRWFVGVLGIILIGGIAYWTSSKQPAADNNIQVNPMTVTSGENPHPGGIHDLPVEPAAANARKDLASKLGIDEKSIVIMQITDTTWNDGCLGLGGPTEICTQELVPGFKVEMLAKGTTYMYRTDKTGVIIRPEAQ